MGKQRGENPKELKTPAHSREGMAVPGTLVLWSPAGTQGPENRQRPQATEPNKFAYDFP